MSSIPTETDGWSGVTDKDKRRAGDLLPPGAAAEERVFNGARVANAVAAKVGSGYHSGAPRPAAAPEPPRGNAWLIDGAGFLWVLAGIDDATDPAAYAAMPGPREGRAAPGGPYRRAPGIDDDFGIAHRGPVVTLAGAR